MKKTLLALAAVAALAVTGGAQTKAPPKMPPMPVKKPMPMQKGKMKPMPMRDPKTGRFMKKPMAPPSKMHPKGMMKKPMPPRDPKTGRFIKKKG